MTELKDRCALVTGGARGIGRAIAEELARRGAKIAVCDIDEAAAAKAAEELKGLGVETMAGKVNVADAAECKAFVDAAAKAWGRLDIMVNNAGITRDNLLMRMKDEEWDDILATNLTSVFRLSRAVLRAMMKARRGRIISIASVVGAMGNAGQTNYGAAKAGIMGFTKSLANEVGSRNITVNCVAPGFIDTDMTRALPDAQRQALLDHIPLGRLGSAQDIAHAVTFLASPDAGYISGATLHVNGGMYMA